MPNIASVLKDEIARIARKELRTETDQLRKSVIRYRSEIAELKRRIGALETQVKRASRQTQRATPAATATEVPAGKLRFSAKRLRIKRERLGLTAGELAKLLTVSTQTVYNWETGKTRPRPEQLVMIAAVRKLSKREAQSRLG